ncbi:hypothetical protein [Stappia sp. TSB10P1A]|uniref:hypothetical protein n=1 Tax=Stappia sp. TSB10P1A TaxID=2003585 RepID=UPI001643A6B6|nr:hypothetical protein [Stappia sp. TSB10P1A]
MPPRSANPARPHVVIVGGGFAGLACARALGGAEIDEPVDLAPPADPKSRQTDRHESGG